MKQKIIAITLGDPEGIGPEIIKDCLSRRKLKNPILIIGHKTFVKINNLKLVSSIREINPEKEGLYLLEPDGDGSFAEPSFSYVETAVEFALRGAVSAIVTGPVAKEKWRGAGVEYNGHTDYLAAKAGVNDHSMFFWSENLKVSLFTSHIPLNKVSEKIRQDKIIEFIKRLDHHLTSAFATKYRFLIPGFNPHAGEKGFLGTEEIKEIMPAVNKLTRFVKIEGPLPPDTIFIKAAKQKSSVVVCWYHDQGLIPFKLLNMHQGVNLTLGLPFIRTSPDHGTATDIAGRAKANPASMAAAITLAEKLISSKN